MIAEEAAKRATVKRPQAYENGEEEEIDKEPLRIISKPGEEQLDEASSRRKEIKNRLEQ